MTRFAATTILAIFIASAACILLPSHERDLTVLAVWMVYLPIFVCGIVFIRMNFFCRAVCRGPAGKMQVALTFDDGPDPDATPALLELLHREKIAATFFCIGKNVAAHPELAARIAGEGHLLANHSYRHPWFISFLLPPWLGKELGRAQRAIQEATGQTPTFFRPPNGHTGPHFGGVLKRTGLTMIGWDVRSLDTVLSASKATQRILSKTRDGSIILLHDGGVQRQKLLEIVETTIKQLRAKGFSFERLDKMLSR
jgi:peptidoglycan/xylan/chitin deacetylase (PgdA/CDA1 family)